MKVTAEFMVDLSHRLVVASIRREFDVTPLTLTVPFAVWKSIAGEILLAEAEAEKHVQDGDGRRPRLVAP